MNEPPARNPALYNPDAYLALLAELHSYVLVKAEPPTPKHVYRNLLHQHVALAAGYFEKVLAAKSTAQAAEWGMHLLQVRAWVHVFSSSLEELLVYSLAQQLKESQEAAMGRLQAYMQLPHWKPVFDARDAGSLGELFLPADAATQIEDAGLGGELAWFKDVVNEATTPERTEVNARCAELAYAISGLCQADVPF